MREMKESKIYYIGKIPSNWQIQKMGRICNVITDYVASGSFASLAENVKYLDEPDFARLIRTMDVSGKYENVKPVYINKHAYDYLKNSNLYGGEIILPNIGGVGEVYIVPKLYDRMSLAPNSIMIKTNYNDKYYYYCFLCDIGTRCLQGISGSTAQAKFNKTDLKTIRMVVPPIEEQQKIADFLDKKVSEIDNIIERTKETIEDYKKYKHSIITKSVTKGLDKNVEMKDSGVEWIGKIPKNSKVIPLKYLVEGIKDGTHGTHERVSEGELLLSAKNINNGNIVVSNNESYITKEEYNKIVANGYPQKNDILMCCVGDVGKTAIYKFDKTFAFQRSVMFIRLKEKLNYNYVNYYLNSESAQIEENLLVNKNIQAGLYQGAIKEVKIVVHENELEKRIIRYLSKKCNEIDNLISSKEKMIVELEQYKKSLIYEYVTGKKEVKEKNSLMKDDSKQIMVNCKDNIFAQAILLCKIIEKLNKYNLGRVKAEKTLYLIEKDVGFNFENNYVREAAGPLSEAIYKCESVISKKNKWIKIHKVNKHIEYEILSDFNKYNKYYERYYSDYDNQIENIINIIKEYSTDKAEMVATLYASWNDFIIKKEEVSDLKIVKDVRENWNDTKKRFDENKWLAVLEEMKQIRLKPKGNGNLTIVKEQ